MPETGLDNPALRTDTVSMPVPATQPLAELPASLRASMLLRCLAIQGSWNYEILVGNGMGFCVEPALRRLPGGIDGRPYREALARQAVYFNAHPYLASLAVGALARAELEQVPPARIERFRTALCGPLGSLGDRLVWAAWLPACSLVALLLFGFGWSPPAVILGFLVLYNVGHLGLRDWGLRAGWKHGLRVATAMGHPVLQHGPRYIGRVSAVLGGMALPLAVHRAIGGQEPLSPIPMGVAVATPVLAVLLVRLQGRAEGWRVVLLLLAAFVLYSVVR
ncbi:MAG: PTS system mannose/fructose/sorbose family transporter subunit IID [Gemmatimonas sp.]|uniref:PTS system mannose/fructose/sorbose family transporter subunit IID n=1 Tax=Gemmatimonas sp. TaxID=1962908 RepID=UPI0022BA82A5|nr:PTS system mannose/fructose/sorbose family transporter subunit IID [Gemmatimonas sp.]MCA2983907.1 PTS system mannose/fructose/sorbose family transporter subunit IID [Gemmatimonas sp.]MCE2953543.1 PTS system mannose/fructose/sorbose family transporter subunit IID [Gemmatimonas sp.]MCZ8010577.1 PTS system mannose/fructose/sorbose family transporter subunit IID [Gemmatimonas sp.]MCZ8267141.1 PTS system mannose/fructose/sorbose family transporter subunit IID [Gemmatimonas sp.]